MRITEELRKWKSNIQTYLSPEVVLQLRCELNDIADRIDEECERRQEDVIDDVLGGLMKMTDEKMAENGWVRLPKDADGEYIHIGDRVENNEKVVRIVLTDESWDPYVYVEKTSGILHEHFCSEIGHYHEPTVEDVLREFSCVLMGKREFDGDVTKAVAEYAKKLQLRED